MAVYVCTVCGYRYDEDKEGIPYEQLKACPACKQPKEKLILAEQEKPKPQQAESSLAYDPA